MNLKGKNVLVTGGTGALGGAVVQAFVDAGANVYVPARRAVPVGANAAPATDVANEAEVLALFAQLPPLWASVHVVGGFVAKPLVETTLADVHEQYDVNFVSAFLCTREAAKQMKGRAGRIVNVAAHSGETAPASMSAYASSKAAVIALSKSAAAELRADGILVNAIAPTTIDTPANRAAMPTANRTNWVAPAAIARTIVWLCSDDNDAVAGDVITLGA
ncbi:MAG TPA: SDR family oxidoreductase [Myxococcota bacterium]|jgi:NAD(P)-dependent dehydrogenase (short-subunit alcohol dehydrogenase family)